MKWVTLVSCVTVTSSALAVDRTVSDIHIPLENWELVPTMIGTQVESFLCLQDETTVIGNNITSIWFLRISDDQWQAFAWSDQDALNSIAHVKNALQLDDSTDINWPNVDAQQGVNPLLAVEPEAFGTGVFLEDSFSEVIKSMVEPGTFIELLTTAGWSAADIEIQTGSIDCAQNELLSTLAALVEADHYMGSDSAYVANFSTQDMECKEWISFSAALGSDGKWSTYDFTEYLGAIASIEPVNAWQNITAGTEYTGIQTIIVDAGNYLGEGQPTITNHFVITLKDFTPPAIEVDISGDTTAFVSPSSSHMYYVSPTNITVTVTANDKVDTNPVINVFHNKLPIVNGTMITELGFHSITAQAIDSSGNESWTETRFEIRNRMDYSGNLYVDNITAPESPVGIEQISVALRLTSEEFDVWTVNTSTLNLWLAEEDGTWIKATGETPALAQYEDNSFIITFVADLTSNPLPALPPNMVMTGRGASGTSSEFDFYTKTATMIDDEPFVSPGEDNRDTPPTGTAECEWRVREDNWVIHEYNEKQPWADAWTIIELYIDPVKINGYGRLIRNYTFPADERTVSYGIGTSGNIHVYLEGDNCCRDCTITVIARPYVAARGELRGGSVSVGATVMAKVNGDLTKATGSLDFNPQGGIKIENDEVTPVDAGDNFEIFQAFGYPNNIVKHYYECHVDIQCLASAYIGLSIPRVTLLDSASDARAEAFFLEEAGLALEVNTSDTCGTAGIQYER